MGIEVYLLSVIFRNAVDANAVSALLTACGAVALPLREFSQHGDYSQLNFEIRSEHGITEIQVHLRGIQSTVRDFAVRFSVLSPSAVIGQTFRFLEELNRRQPLDLYDHEGHGERIPIDPVRFCMNRSRIGKRQLVCGNEQGLVIEGGMKSWTYIVEHELADHYFRARFLPSRFQRVLQRLRIILHRWL